MLVSATADVALGAPLATRQLAFDGAKIDGGLYLDVTNFARTAPGWFDTLVKEWSAFGIVTFFLLMIVGWWLAKRLPAQNMAKALCAPVAVVVVYVINDLIKSVVQEVRPCRQLPHVFHLEACQAPTDWAFPSNHTVVAFSAATALFMVARRLGLVAYVLAVLMGASRVYVGAHYPHDVAAGIVVGVVFGVLLTWAAGRFGADRVLRAREGGRLRPLLVDVPSGAHGRLPGSGDDEPGRRRREAPAGRGPDQP
ncbi:phosphatase PAP2 family protein [Streptomyces sp. SL13]|uniref:Phosphatase PAP2 family protein n=1 Tax=Streptantibioticus silvisoli TaxID=2705255 RepID=A0AA90GXK1_9ACTN|nr:phosphatase PAP2 family protein [Streptantibioticus silvisoli]MDI5962899.1 phosphatase PAP2 family protein [Streptantibioticus silvisoli]MDI5969729.1 phosphatase PAP2 family protein [Streptantibioticus silvisoli]